VAVIFSSKFVAGDVVQSEAFVRKFNRIENYINGGILAQEVKYKIEKKPTQRWVKPVHIFKPEFFGSPDPRVVATSGTIHHRFSPVGRVHRSIHHGLSHDGHSAYDRESVDYDTQRRDHSKGKWMRQRFWPEEFEPNAGKWQTIRGMGVTVFNDGDQLRSDGDGGKTRDVIVTGSLSCWEQGSFDPNRDSERANWKKVVLGKGDDAYGPEKVECARLGMFIDGVLEGTSVRRIFTSRRERWVVKNFMWTNFFACTPGYHHIDFRLKVLRRFKPTADPPDRWWRIMVDSRSMVVDMQNFREDSPDGWLE
jgi:hypothetical protein